MLRKTLVLLSATAADPESDADSHPLWLLHVKHDLSKAMPAA